MAEQRDCSLISGVFSVAKLSLYGYVHHFKSAEMIAVMKAVNERFAVPRHANQ